MYICRDHFLYAPNQWETTLHCNVVSYWLDAYTTWPQPIRDDVTLQRCLSLAECIHNCYLPDIITSISWLRGRPRFSLHTHHDKPWWPLTWQRTRISTLDDVSAQNYVSCYITNHNQSYHFLKMHLSSEAWHQLSPYFVAHVPGKPYMSQVVEVLSCYLILLSTDRKDR